MKALILAAGKGRRMGGAVSGPKCLLNVGGRTLLDRMIGSLTEIGIFEIIIVVGYQSESIRNEIEQIGPNVPISFVDNPQYELGSLLSLWAARDRFGEDDLVIMDADVLFGTDLLRKLVNATPRTAFLMDTRQDATGEEMMLTARGNRVVRIARGIDPSEGETFGEGVGFLKVGKADQAILQASLASFVEADDGDRDYEDAVDRFLNEAVAEYEETAGAPWTEIDFPEDVEKAESDILPRL